MKTYLILLLFIAAIIPLHSFAQRDERIDVVYLKSGTIYRGTIVEQVPGVSFKIEIAGGSVIVIKADEVVKITKESKPVSTTTTHALTQEEWQGHKGRSRFQVRGYKDKGGFLQLQISPQFAGGSLRLIGGYKINQFAMLGLGAGGGGVACGANQASMGTDLPYGGFYFPFFIYYSGDILQKDITPFYAAEIGYAMANNFNGPSRDLYYYNQNTSVYNIRGGVMGSAGFGVRFYKGRKFVCSISANLDVQESRLTTHTYIGQNAGAVTQTYSSICLLIPALKIGLGFVK